MAEVTLKNIGKVFGDVRAVESVSVDVADKEFVVLVGPSGCGKSTTLRMIAGLEEITEGEILIDGRVVNDVAPKDRDIAMVFQNYALYPHMSVYKNMAFGLMLRKFPKDEIKKRVNDAAQILGIEHLLERKPKALSGGERQRVAVGRAIVRHPKVFLFDEPLSNLDAKLRVQMRAELIKLHQRLQATMIYVTHDQTEAMTMGDRIVILKDGKVQQIAKPLDLYDHPANKFVAGFIGSPPMNLMDGKIISTGGAFVFDNGAIRVDVPADMSDKLASYDGKIVCMGIRPEHIQDPLDAVSNNPGSTVNAKIDVVELMGSELYAYLNSGDTQITARFESHREAKAGMDKDIVFDMTKAHFFDCDTEEALN
ncbi:ABC transporter ATP-binding protein [Candidatus Hydrogenedentota bacterium]